MTSIADGTVRIQTSSQSLASPPSWFGAALSLPAMQQPLERRYYICSTGNFDKVYTLPQSYTSSS